MASRLLQICHKSEKRQWHYNLRHNVIVKLFWRCPIFLVKFSYFSKFHVNFMTGSGVMRIYFCKELIRNPEIGNTPVWVLPNIWRLWQVTNAKVGKHVSNKMCMNAAKCQGYGFYRFWVIKERPTGGKTTSLPLLD